MQTTSESDVSVQLSPHQKRLWTQQQSAPPQTYRVQAAFLIKGEIDPEMFKTAVRSVIEQHEILRTRFESKRVALTACLSSDSYLLPLQEYDLERLNTEQQEERIATLFEEDGQQAFDLEHNPLLRLMLLRLSPSEHMLIASQPALCADMGTLKNLVNEIILRCSARLPGAEQVDEPMQYSDFSEWQNELLETEEMQMGATFWRKQLVPPLFSAKLPYEKVTASQSSFVPEVASQRLKFQTVIQLEQLAAKYQSSLDILLLTCWQVLLGRLTGQAELIVGTAYNWRSYGDAPTALGLFTKHLPLKTRVDGTLPFHECLQQVTHTAHSLIEWQDYFNWDEASEPKSIAALPKYFPFNFDFEEYRTPPGSLAPLSISISRWYACLEQFKVKLSCIRTDVEVFCEFHYDTAVFCAADIEHLSREFQTLLQSVLANPEASLSELAILNERDIQQLIVEFNRTKVEHPLQVCIHELFEAQVARAPAQVAVVFEGQQLTYHELNRRANQLARYLRSLGVGPEVLVGICLDRSLEMVIGLLGILKAGGGYVPLDPTYPMERLALMLEDAQVPVLVTQEHLVGNLPVVWAQVICIDSSSDLISRESDENLNCGVTAANTAYVMYTSGTTGKPKGVVIEHRGIANLVAWQAANFKLSSESRISQFASYSFDAAVGETFMALLNGATLVMLNREHLEPAKLVGAINDGNINVCVLVPSLIKELDPNLITHPRRLTIVAVGEACSSDLATRWAGKCNFMNAYGPTEYSVYSHLWKVDKEFVVETGCVPIGPPIDNARSYILDSQLNPVPCGLVGEIYISGPGIARGYLNNPELTAQKFIPNKFARAQDFTEHGLLLMETVNSENEAFKKSHTPGQPGTNGHARKRISTAAIFKLVAALDEDLIEKTHGFVDNYCQQNSVYEGFCRYLLEGVKGSYASCGINKEVLRRLLPYDSFSGLRGTDLGFGNTEILQALAGMGASMTGLDFNPFFVQKGRSYGLDTRMVKIDVTPEKFLRESKMEAGSQDFALSTLLLDRLEKPKNSLRNLLLTLKDGGRFAIQTLLPIVGMDDGDVDDPIVYTPEPNRVTPGDNAEQDKLTLISLLHSYGARDIEVYQLPYTVASRDGVQEYTLWSFIGCKGAERVSARNHFETMYKTGDLGRYLSNGSIEFRGRVDHQVKRRGFRVELGDIEATLLSSPKIKDCVVVASQKGPGPERLIAYLVPADDHSPKIGEFQTLLKEKLPEYMIPSAYVMLAELPLTLNGKVDRGALPAAARGGAESESKYVGARTEAEQTLVEIWEAVLGVERVGIYDNFFELGGDSILSIQIVARTNRAGLHLTPKDLFQHQEIAGLAQVSGAGAEVVGAEQGAVSGAVRLTPIQEWLFGSELAAVWHYNQSVLLQVKGEIEEEKLVAALQGLLGQHDALRQRFKQGAAGWEGWNEAGEELSYERVDLSGAGEGARGAAIEARAAAVQGSLNLSAGPLVRAVYFDCGADEAGRLLLVVHHLVVDGVSWRILLEDLQRGYEQLRGGEAVELGAKSTSFQGWAEQLYEQAQGAELQAEAGYWEAQGWERARALPVEKGSGGEQLVATAGRVSKSLSEVETRQLLQEVPETYHTQINEVLMTALGRALGGWLGEGEVVIEVEGHGREEVVAGVELSRTVGWFTTIYPVLLAVGVREELGAGLKRVKEQLRQIPQHGIGFGMLKYLSAAAAVRERLRRVPGGAVSFNYLGQFDQVLSSEAVIAVADESSGPVQSSSNQLEYQLSMNSIVRKGQLEVTWGYSKQSYETATINQLAENYMGSLREIIAHCESGEAGGFTPSDFPEVNLSQSDLDKFISRISQAVRE